MKKVNGLRIPTTSSGGPRGPKGAQRPNGGPQETSKGPSANPECRELVMEEAVISQLDMVLFQLHWVVFSGVFIWPNSRPNLNQASPRTYITDLTLDRPSQAPKLTLTFNHNFSTTWAYFKSLQIPMKVNEKLPKIIVS